MTSIAKVARIPKCQFDNCAQPAEYDFKTTEGPWAYGCKEHFNLHAKYDLLGMGKGQKLVLRNDRLNGSNREE
jgi:hypothetical protein